LFQALPRNLAYGVKISSTSVAGGEALRPRSAGAKPCGRGSAGRRSAAAEVSAAGTG
jgi:hypothetical protein